MADFTARRRNNIKQNELLLDQIRPLTTDIEPQPEPNTKSKSIKRKADPSRAPTRQSKRIATAGARPVYNDDQQIVTHTPRRKAKIGRATNTKRAPSSNPDPESDAEPAKNAEAIVAGWTAWTPEAEEPTRDDAGTFHFESHPDFRPNKSPEEIIREGSFGGSYWRPLFSKRLRITVRDDWRELPASWTAGLDVDTYLTSTAYSPEVNKYGVACGQSIEEWEAAGWIAHEYDVRGWFQWYCRFWMGRRCADDERQISRWKKCVGETGRWRRTLLKKYVALGIRSVFADDEDDDVGDTCHHWAYEVRQEALERFWAEGR
ncbi:unnamed protein product [Clonostachys rosea]|uniref:Vegetatible incompatibility protein HET-E-1 n=1 Tax=Bionectria ochroleuca TaxID=29856 RepID=A0ABY6ULF7_BIOOC|nr:unnamed protein product [Clonostachys rosea]